MPQRSNRWTTLDGHRTIVLLSGIALLLAGVVLMCSQTAAQGSIDIKTAFVTGKIESGSAGVLCLFIGVILILLVMLRPRKSVAERTAEEVLKQQKLVLVVLFMGGSLAVLALSVLFPQVQLLAAVILVVLFLPMAKKLLNFD